MSARYSLPVMSACTSCGQCCGPAMASRDEIKRIRRLLKDTGETWIAPGDDDPLRCGFLRRDGDATRCAVYEARPWVCRAFGVVKQMPCDFFPDSAIVDMPADEAVGSGRMPATAKLLGEAFEPGYYLRTSHAAALRRAILDAGR